MIHTQKNLKKFPCFYFLLGFFFTNNYNITYSPNKNYINTSLPMNNNYQPPKFNYNNYQNPQAMNNSHNPVNYPAQKPVYNNYQHQQPINNGPNPINNYYPNGMMNNYPNNNYIQKPANYGNYIDNNQDKPKQIIYNNPIKQDYSFIPIKQNNSPIIINNKLNEMMMVPNNYLINQNINNISINKSMINYYNSLKFNDFFYLGLIHFLKVFFSNSNNRKIKFDDEPLIKQKDGKFNEQNRQYRINNVMKFFHLSKYGIIDQDNINKIEYLLTVLIFIYLIYNIKKTFDNKTHYQLFTVFFILKILLFVLIFHNVLIKFVFINHNDQKDSEKLLKKFYKFYDTVIINNINTILTKFNNTVKDNTKSKNIIELIIFIYFSIMNVLNLYNMKTKNAFKIFFFHQLILFGLLNYFFLSIIKIIIQKLPSQNQIFNEVKRKRQGLQDVDVIKNFKKIIIQQIIEKNNAETFKYIITNKFINNRQDVINKNHDELHKIINRSLITIYSLLAIYFLFNPLFLQLKLKFKNLKKFIMISCVSIIMSLLKFIPIDFLNNIIDINYIIFVILLYLLFFIKTSGILSRLPVLYIQGLFLYMILYPLFTIFLNQLKVNEYSVFDFDYKSFYGFINHTNVTNLYSHDILKKIFKNEGESTKLFNLTVIKKAFTDNGFFGGVLDLYKNVNQIQSISNIFFINYIVFGIIC